MEYNLIVIAFIIIVYLWARLAKLEGRMKGMQDTLNHLTDQFDFPENPVIEELRELIKRGEDIKAVKRAREVLGLSLLEGKNYIDKLKSEIDHV